MSSVVVGASPHAREGRDGKGCVILFAAGNEASPVHGVDSDGDDVLAGFAKHPDVMAIAASNSHDRQSHYSNFGSEIWVAAPSSGAGWRGILTTDWSGSPGYEEGDYTIDDPFGGTSSSTPLVAGICGLMLSVNPNLTAQEVREILRDTAEKIDPANGNYNAQGHSDKYGFGRVNAFKAVQEAQRRVARPDVDHLVFDRSPQVAIPDNDAARASDSVVVAHASAVRSVSVSVDIRHTFRGDLKVELVSPRGERATLHNRTGGGGDNLVETYDLNNAPSLRQLTGDLSNGRWTLAVTDLARIDVGTLDAWSLTLGVDSTDQTEWEANPGATIPDNSAQGVSSDIDVASNGPLQDIELTVDITHTFRGDLFVSLEAPNGQRVQVHNRRGGGEDHLRQTFRPASNDGLQELLDNNVEINGTWTLHVADLARVDVGKLNSWKLKLIT